MLNFINYHCKVALFLLNSQQATRQSCTLIELCTLKIQLRLPSNRTREGETEEVNFRDKMILK
jgi:hypothetical protein